MTDFSSQQKEIQPGITSFSLSGKIKSDNVDQFEAVFQKILQSGCKKVILDFSPLEFLNSKAVGIILRTLGVLRKTGGDMVVVNVSPQILQVFQLLTLDKIMKFYSTVPDAVAGFQK